MGLILPSYHKIQGNFRQHFPGEKRILLSAIIAYRELRCGLHAFKYFSRNLTHIQSLETYVPSVSALLFKRSALFNSSEFVAVEICR